MEYVDISKISHEIYKEACLALKYEKAENCLFIISESFFKALENHMINNLCMGLSVRGGYEIKLHGIKLFIIPDYLYGYQFPYRLLRNFDVNEMMREKLGGKQWYK